MKTIPDFVILDISSIIQDCREQLSQSWIYTVDVEFILQNLFNVFIDVQNTESNLETFYIWLKNEGLETKTENTKLQTEFILHVVKDTAQKILTELIELGYYTYEYFPYDFKRILFEDSVLLSRNLDYSVRI